MEKPVNGIISDYRNKVVQLEQQISTLTDERDELSQQNIYFRDRVKTLEFEKDVTITERDDARKDAEGYKKLADENYAALSESRKRVEELERKHCLPCPAYKAVVDRDGKIKQLESANAELKAELKKVGELDTCSGCPCKSSFNLIKEENAELKKRCEEQADRIEIQKHDLIEIKSAPLNIQDAWTDIRILKNELERFKTDNAELQSQLKDMVRCPKEDEILKVMRDTCFVDPRWNGRSVSQAIIAKLREGKPEQERKIPSADEIYDIIQDKDKNFRSKVVMNHGQDIRYEHNYWKIACAIRKLINGGER